MRIIEFLTVVMIMVIFVCSISTISATSNESINVASMVDYGNENVSINYNFQLNEMEDDLLNNQGENKDILYELDDDESDDEFDESDDDIDDEFDDENTILDDEDIDEYLEGIDASDEYLKFVKYLIKDKKFRFNNFLDESDDDTNVVEDSDNEGYYIYSSEPYNGKSYDGSEIQIRFGHPYFIPTNQRISYILDDYYPDVVYLKGNQYSLDELYLGWLKNDEKYQSSVYTSNKNITSTAPYYNSSDLPPAFDLRNVNGQKYTTPAKNQGTGDHHSNCWAFASISALESHLLKTENKSYEFSTDLDYSENNLKNVMSSLGEKGTDLPVNDGGKSQMPLAYFIRWSGPILDSQDRYLNNNVVEDYKPLKHVQGLKYIPPRKNSTDNGRIKEAVYNYGGVVTSLYWVDLCENNQSYFNPIINKGMKHEVCIIGWDDNYSKENFNMNLSTMGDGAFIVKNSYGNKTGDEGYFYVSYYDIALARYAEDELGGATGYAFTLVENNTNFGKNYNYSPLGTTYWYFTNSSYFKYRNQWTTNSNVTLKSCGVYVNDAVYCSVAITINDIKVGETDITSLNYGGFHTIPFISPVKINKGQTFAIEVTLISNANNILLPFERQYSIYSKATANFNESEYFNGTEWIDLTTVYKNTNFCIHAYTEYGNLTPTKIEATDLTINHGGNKTLTATLYDSNNIPLKNNEITFSINGENHNVLTDNNGQASIQINEDVGIYKVIIQYFGNEKYEDCRKTITLTIKSQSNIKQKTDVTIYLDNIKINSIIKFHVISSNNKLLSGEKVILKVGSKKYKKTLDRNGKFKSKKIFTNVAKVKVIYKGSEKYNKKTKSAYIYEVINKIDGFKSCKSDDKLSLAIPVKKLNVYFTLSGKQKKIKFKNKKATFNVKKYNLKSGKTYKLTFTSKSKLYHVDYTYKLKIKK